MMKQIRRILTILCAAMMMVCTGTKVKADYKYKVTVLAGLHGTINSGDKIEVEYSPNQRWNQNDFLGKVTVDMETRADGSKYQKYYLRGFHVSGNEDIVGTKDITEDTVFVASYGVAGQIVKYTVYYVDAAGNTLHEKEEFFGNVGDKAVVSFQYVEGYVPNAYSMAKSLSATESENVFTFTYRPGQAVPGGGGGTTGTGGYTYIDGGTEIVYLPGTGGGGGNANANAGGNQNGVNPNNAAPANQQNANAADNNAGQDAAQPADQGPAEMIDLDDTDVPLANVTSPSPDAQVTPVNPQSPLNGFWIAALLASGLGILALIAILIMLLRRKRKEHFQG